MEDSKLMSAHDGCFYRKRSGMALPMALIIVLIGSIMIAAIFDVVSSLSKASVQQRETYIKHAEMTGLLEQTKGALSVYMRDRQRPLHPDSWYAGLNPANRLNTSSIIVSNVNDLLINASRLSGVSTVLNFGGGRATTDIFDISYTVEEVSPTMTPADRALLPSPLSLESILMGRTLTRSSLMDIDLVDIGVREGLTDINKPGDETQLVGTNREAYGAYLIRVSFFKALGTSSFDSRPSHVIEQAFFQVVSDDRRFP